jgi:acyl carrier protein
MTIEQVVGIVEEQTGQKVSSDTELSELGLDSLEFLSLLVEIGIPDAVAPRIHTVNDLFLAAQ